jgi:uroporphyrinogen decarboxylase
VTPYMTPRQRVMTVLKGGLPDRVPWIEGEVNEPIQSSLMEGRTGFTQGDLCRKLGLDGFGWTVPSEARAFQEGFGLASPEAGKEAFYHPPSVTFDFTPPWIAEMGRDSSTGRWFLKKGLLTSRDKLALLDEYLPDPHHPARYETVARWIEQYREDFAVFARIRLGSAATIESMGLNVFSLMLYDDPDLVKEIHLRFSEWQAAVIEHLNKMDFDFYWVFDDVADTKAPWVSPDMYEEFLKPYQKIAVDAMNNKPWIFHSDGNLVPILDNILTLGMNALHPVQPSAMDINKLKKEYGDRVCIVGNIDLDYTLTRGTVEEVEAEVKDRIQRVGKGGGYMISTSNSITDFCKTENVFAMARAIEKYRSY